MHKKQKTSGKYLSLAFYFVGIFAVIIVSSLIWKGMTLLKKSTYDGQHQFILATTSMQGEPLHIAVFSPEDKTITLFSVDQNNNTDGLFPIPFDAKEVGENVQGSDSQTLLQAMIFPKSNSRMTILDAFKLWMIDKSATVTTKNIHDITTDIKNFGQIFIDKDLYQEAKPVAIVNETGKTGFGNDVSQMLTAIGINVISVGGTGEIDDTTRIEYTGDESYTLSRLARIFATTPTKSTSPSQVADITIIIGKDYLQN